MRKLFITLIVCGVLGTPGTLPAAPDAPALPAPAWDLGQLMSALAQVKSGEVRFTEKKTSSMLDEPLVLHGTLSYSAPSHLEKHITSPYDERYQVDGDTLLVENRSKHFRRSFSLRRYPSLWAFVESFRATLTGDLPTLQRFYEVKLEGGRSDWTLRLIPLDRQMARAVRDIRIAGSGRHIARMEIDEANGDRSVMRIDKGAS